MSLEGLQREIARRKRMERIDNWKRTTPDSLKVDNFREELEGLWQGNISSLSRKQLEEFLEHPTNFLILAGDPGLGKSAMASGICLELITRGIVRSALFSDVPTIMRKLSFSDNRMGLISRLCRPDILVLDDVRYASMDSMSEVRRNGMWSIVNERWKLGKITIITTNLPITSTGEEPTIAEWFQDALWDRICESLIMIKFKGTSLRKRKAFQRRSKTR